MRRTDSQKLIAPILILVDMVILYASLFFAYEIRFHTFLTDYFPITKGLPSWSYYQLALYFVIPLYVSIFFQLKLYKVYFLPFIDELIRIIRAISIGTFFLVMTTFFYRDVSYSRLTFIIFLITSVIMIFGFREVFKLVFGYILRYFRIRENILIVGKSNRALKSVIKKHLHFQVFYSPYEEEKNIESIKKKIIKKSISQVIVIHNHWNDNLMMEFYDWCENMKVELKLVPDIVQICRGEVSIDSSLGMPIFHLRSISLSGLNFYLKRIVDIILSISVLSFLWPFLFIIAVMIVLDSRGPFLYKHKRMGYRGKVFNFMKFRTMVVNADELLEKYKNISERKGPVFKMKNDPRVTNIGRFLRRYSIDEIPQLINVLRGEMSLVGPRPQVLWEAAAYDDWSKRRLRILPGITGLWQVSGRASLSYEEMIELDIFYIENWSLGFDIQILLKTFPAVFSNKGAC